MIDDHDIPLLPKLPFEIEEYILSIFYSSEDISPSRLHGDLFAPTDLWGEGPGHLGHTPQIGPDYSNYHQRLLDRETRVQSLRSLSSCSLVCRYWSSKSQKLLFYWVMIYDAPTFDKLCALLADPGKANLASSIHHISFIYSTPHEKLEEFIPRLAALQLPNLHTLDIIAYDSEGAVSRKTPFSFDYSFLEYTSKMANIRHLHLGNLSFINLDTLQQLVNGFQNVRRLSYSALKCGTEEFGDFRYFRRARDRTIRDMYTHTSDALALRGFQCAGPLDMMPTNQDMVPILTPHVQGFLEDILEILSDNLIKYSWEMDLSNQQWQLDCYSSMPAMAPSISLKFVDFGLLSEPPICFDERHLVSIRAEITAPHFVSSDSLRHLDELLVQFGNLETLGLDFGAHEFSGLLYQNLSGLGQLYAEYLPLTRRRCRLELSVQGSGISWEDLFDPEKGIRDVTDYRDLGRGWISEGSHEYSMEWLSSLTSVESLTNSVIIPILCGLLPKDAFPKKRSNEATFLLNTVQCLLEEPYITESFDAHGLLTHKRPLLKRLLMRLSRETGSLPDVTFLSGIHGGQHPVTGGSFGDIYRGKLNGMDIALKRLRIFANTTPKEVEKLNADFCVEAVVWRHLKHVNVLPFLGVDLQTFKPHLCMVSPWMQNGNVMTCRSRIPDPNDPTAALQVMTWIVEVARGLQYLHSEDVIHADLRGANILVDGDKHVKLTDFGLSKYIGAGPATCTVSHGAARWQPVDVLQEISHPSCASDVYSFGCVCLELYTGQIPFASYPTEWKFMAALHSGHRLEIPPSEKLTPKLLELFKNIVLQCWDDDSSKRPTMVAILDHLEDWYQN